MKKRALIIVLIAGASISASAATVIVQQYIANNNGPLELIVKNTSSGSSAMTELRAINDSTCANDLGVVSTTYSADGGVGANEAFLIGESGCAGLLIKQNNGTHIRFSLGLAPEEKMRVKLDGLHVTHAGDTVLNVINTSQNIWTGILSDQLYGYVGTRTNQPIHIMAHNNARVTVYGDANVEVWRSSNCPAGGNPQWGGFLCVNAQGALLYKGPNGTVTVLAKP
jgi:hypothetical protein